MKTAIIAIAIALALIGGAIYFNSNETNISSSNTVPTTSGTGDASVETTKNNIDLGDIPIRGGRVNIDFSFRNTGNKTLKLTKGATSCMCTEAVVKKGGGEVSPRIKMPGHGSSGRMNMEIAPGEEATLTATYDPMAHGPNGIGPITRDIRLQTDSKTDPEIRFTFIGNVTK